MYWENFVKIKNKNKKQHKQFAQILKTFIENFERHKENFKSFRKC